MGEIISWGACGSKRFVWTINDVKLGFSQEHYDRLMKITDAVWVGGEVGFVHNRNYSDMYDLIHEINSSAFYRGI